MQTMIPFATLLPLRLDEGATACLVERVGEGLRAIEALFPAADDEAIRGNVLHATIRYLMLTTSLVFGGAARHVAYETARSLPLLGEMRNPLDEKEARWVELLSAGDYQTLDEEYGAGILEAVLVANQRNLLQVGNEAAEVALLNRRLDHFNSSVSFRVGRAVTHVPRKAAALLRETKARRRRARGSDVESENERN